jgi:hypothetical protein
VAAQLLDIRLMQVLGISLVAMGVISIAIFEFATEGGVTASIEGGRVKAFKGEEYEVVLKVKSRANDWLASLPPTLKLETAQLLDSEPLTEGRTRLRFLGTYAGRSQKVEVEIPLADPLKLIKRPEHAVCEGFVLDTLPLSVIDPDVPHRLTIFGFGDKPTGYPGPGHELYGLGEYTSGDTKDIVWKRVAKSPDERLTARVREASVREVVKVGVVKFADRGEGTAAWTDVLCEALGYIGKEVLEVGALFAVLCTTPRAGDRGAPEGWEERSPGITQLTARDVVELAEAVMSCSVAPGSRQVEDVVRDADFVITGLRELEDGGLAMLVAGRPTLLIPEEAPPPATLAAASVLYSGRESLFPLIRKVLER